MQGFWKDINERGLVQDFTPGIEALFQDKPVRGYIGFDPSAASLTIGNLVPIAILRLFQKHGYSPIVLLGGATGRIGDPSGKRQERTLLDLDTITANVERQRAQMAKLLNFDSGPARAIMVNNYDFYQDMNVLHFLRDVGKLITVNYMLAKDSVKNRIETGISFTEFSYQLIQGYDFVCLARDYDCVLQMGGSDQWGNITTGIEMTRKTLDKEVHAFTTPLLVKPDGEKYGKSEGENIWLDPGMTSPFKFYQFWLNASDQMIGQLLRRFSLEDMEVIKDVEAAHAAQPELRNAQRFLARELTAVIHSPEQLAGVEKTTELLFNKQFNREALLQLVQSDFDLIAQEIPTKTVSKEQLADGGLVKLLAETGISKSNSEARKAIDNRAVSLNKTKIEDVQAKVTAADLLLDRYLFIENGFKNKFLLSFA
jgi:tyrosyl-tRNA synthetase